MKNITLSNLDSPTTPILSKGRSVFLLMCSLAWAAHMCVAFVASAAPSLKIRQAGPGEVELQWQARPGFAYQLLKSPTLQHWAYLAPPMAGPVMETNVSLILPVEVTSQYYRLSVLGLSTSPLPNAPGHYAWLDFEHDGLPRGFRLHIPANYSGDEDWPLALILHGHGQTAESFANLHPDLFRVAEEKRMIVVLPQSTTTSNGTSWFSQPGRIGDEWVDDVGFLLDLIDHLDTALAIDRKRIYAAGFSNGGKMCHRLAAETTQVFAAYAMVGSNIGGATEDDSLALMPPPAEPMPVMQVNATNDCGSLYFGGFNEDGRFIPPARDSVERWIEINACMEPAFVSTNLVVTNQVRRFNACGPKPPAHVIQTNLVIREHWLGSEAGTEVLFVTLTDGGHKWTDDADHVGFNCNEEVLDFFSRHCRCDAENAEPETAFPSEPGTYDLTMCDQRYRRALRLMIPSNYTAATALPLTMALHGGGQSKDLFWAIHPGLETKCQTENVILVVPDATMHPGAGIPLWGNKPFSTVVDDRVFLTNLVDRIASAVAVDRKRIYAAGFSNGGSMCHYLAATTSGWLAGIVPVGCATGWNDPITGAIVPPPPPSEPMAVLMIRGTDDVKRPYLGGPNIDGVLIRSAEDDLDYWTTGSACAAGFTLTSTGQAHTRLHALCAGTTEVGMVRVDGMPHLWPDLDDGYGIDANQVAIDFLLRHARP